MKKYTIELTERQLQGLAYACRVTDRLILGQLDFSLRECCEAAWEKRIKDIQEGKAFLSVRQWSGKPYWSKQIEIARLTTANGVGIQKLCFLGDNFNGGYIRNGAYPSDKILAKNDGLSLADWEEWFRGYDLSKPLAIIHFTKFRY